MQIIDDLPLATDAELATLPPGLYVACDDAGVPRERIHEGVYDAALDVFESGPVVLLARVRESGPIPAGCDVIVRGDGYQIIKQWVLSSVTVQ